MASYEHFYGGTPYSLDGNYGNFIGYQLPTTQVGTSLRPDTAAQLTEATNNLNQGFKQIEVGGISSEILDQIPKQHFKEMNRITKLTGSQISLHAPIQDIEASGIATGQGGGQFSEVNREIVERKLIEAIDKAHEINPEKPVPVTMHSANMPGTQFVRGDPKKGEDIYKEEQIMAVNRETGQLGTVFREDERAYPHTIAQYGKPRTDSPQERLDNQNKSQWINQMQELAGFKKSTDEILDKNRPEIINVIRREEQGIPIENSESIHQLSTQLEKSNIFLENVETAFGSMFEKAYKYSDDEKVKKELNKLAKEYSQQDLALRKAYANQDKGKYFSASSQLLEGKSKLLDQAIVSLRQIENNPPQILQKVEDFAMDKSSKTFANVALHSYKKYGKNAPIVSIENLYTGMAFAKPEDFKNLVHKSREEFVKAAVKDGMSKSEAERAAKSTIGVTWDVGHLNMLRQKGFKEKDLVDATKLIGKDVKHIHLTDNFGYNDSHLAPGMGNVPIKKHLEQLEKSGALNRDTMVINEIGGFVNQFRQSPLPYMLEAFGSPVYAEGPGPGWNQALYNQGSYFAFPSAMFPDYHFQSYGGLGFSALPRELGGQAAGGGGDRSRFTGTPNA